ncbi:right-handed parallel beta-helix repeat-containing protein [Georgenia thermotolerans]|uniref:Right-handed parallel beta-helix repeat-containing protein n=1 Tax=Georgenia thermotolerans TaxID=527326 RepID=A0A7J5URM4_9MICO|nr:right-handed parallel beta-helix repeat-containing protein [Georgenia thermotolerans]KAE8764880.1 hypothetical protein GB883_06645 [Georgenia thermotolerans]
MSIRRAGSAGAGLLLAAALAVALAGVAAVLVLVRGAPAPPTAAAAGAGSCDTFPQLPENRPTAATTGVSPDAELVESGSLLIETPGTVVEGKEITGNIVINADDVTIRNNRINVTEWYGITYDEEVTGTKIIGNEILTEDGGYVAIAATDAVICGNYIHGFENAITLGRRSIVQANFIEKFQGMPGEDPHFDGIEIYHGSHTHVWGNNIMLTDPSGAWLEDTGAVNITTHWSDIKDVDIRGNWIGGGSYTLYVEGTSDHDYDDIRIIDNRWYGDAPAGHAAWGAISVNGTEGISAFEGNAWDDTENPVPLPKGD